MPRDLSPWRGKEAPPPPLPTAPAGTPPAAPAPRAEAVPPPREAPPAALPCPACGRTAVARLASGALGCTACGEVFARREERPPEPEPEAAPPERALDSIGAIDAMLRRNQLVLGPGGVPLAEEPDPATPARRRSRRRNRS